MQISWIKKKQLLHLSGFLNRNECGAPFSDLPFHNERVFRKEILSPCIQNFSIYILYLSALEQYWSSPKMEREFSDLTESDELWSPTLVAGSIGGSTY